MFKKYSPEECKQAGIEKEDECKDFMANKYTKQIIELMKGSITVDSIENVGTQITLNFPIVG